VEIVQHLRKHDQDRGPDHRAEAGGGASEQDGKQKKYGAEELEIVGTDVVLLMGEQCAAESGKGGADDEDDDLEAIDIDADRGDRDFAVFDGSHPHAETR